MKTFIHSMGSQASAQGQDNKLEARLVKPVIHKLFKGRTLVVATMHGKENMIGPLFEQSLGVSVVVAKGLNTDVFGTFSGEVERSVLPIDAARHKCEAAQKLTGESLVLASEGSFGAHPIMGFIAANEEVLLLCDYENGFEIKTKVISAQTNFSGQAFEKWEEVVSYAKRVHFPSHGLIVRPNNGVISEVHKGIYSWEQLKHSFYYFHKNWGGAFVETDMRAHYNPTRMNVIHEAALQLLTVLMNSCPVCEGPGFDVRDVIRGLPCGLCNQPTKAAKAHVYYCQHCQHEETIGSSNDNKYEDPMFCDVCNP